ncbi:PucR family transcriptional regulator [Rhodococcus sp. ACT016]|uniref:PucR family transcriptional regulator n=1 Tax=Rhodococcus sp. ACT016 TaxID=3134808 RepID=UPI003D2E7EA7
MSELTVGDLVAMRQLGCQTIAGSGGLDRPVVWAHSCELDDPWNWVATDELLMTTGMCIPSDEAGQVEMVRQLHKAGIAGMAIGDDLKAPPLTDAMLDTANTLDLPVLTVSHSTPFSAIGRTVGVATQSEQITRIARLSRLYEVARSATLADSSLLDRLSAELGHRLHVIDVEFGTEVLGRQGHVPTDTVRALCQRVGGKLDRLPARQAITVGDELVATAFALSTHRKCMLVVDGASDIDMDAFGLLHAQSLIGIEVERATRERERDDAAGALLFQQIVDGSLGSDAAQPRLEQSGLADREWIVIAFDAQHLRAARINLGDSAFPNLSSAVGEEGYVMADAGNMSEAVELLTGRIPHLGISAPTSTIQRLPDSVRQARWALQAARADGSAVAEYSTASPLFLPRTLSEATFAARAVLGDLMDHDAANQSQLVETLDAFLTLDRSWSATAEKLMIHRQTLAYRLKRIETITGRSTKSSADISTFWMALIALRISRGGTE